MANAVRDRISLYPDLAWVRYNDRQPIDDGVAENAETAAFVKSATAGNIDAAFATKVIQAQIDAGKDVERSLILNWSTGVVPAPTGSAPSLASETLPKIQAATIDLSQSMVALQPSGAPKGWADYLQAAGVKAAQTLPDGVSDEQYFSALDLLKKWPKK